MLDPIATLKSSETQIEAEKHKRKKLRQIHFQSRKSQRSRRKRFSKDIYKHFIKHKLSTLTLKRGYFTERIKKLKVQIQRYLDKWNELSLVSQRNLYRNVIFMHKILNQHSLCKQEVKLAGTLPFMQFQGRSSYCGLCALNNAFGEEKVSVLYMDHVADDLWLRQFEELGQSLIDSIQPLRDINGSYSLHVLEEVASVHGYSLESLHPVVRKMIQDRETTHSTQTLMNDIKHSYSLPLSILFVDMIKEHYTTVRVDPLAIWLFDSLEKKPRMLTVSEFLDYLQAYTNSVYALISKPESGTEATSEVSSIHNYRICLT